MMLDASKMNIKIYKEGDYDYLANGEKNYRNI